ncbi:MAG: hypothetical protein Q4B40_05290 [Clostridia bacterium]|nr:hypothetical protein [Clostridia bacterium]
MKKALSIICVISLLLSFAMIGGCAEKKEDKVKAPISIFVESAYENSKADKDDVLPILSQQAKNKLAGIPDGTKAADEDIMFPKAQKGSKFVNIEVTEIKYVEKAALEKIQAKYDEICGENEDKITEAAKVSYKKTYTTPEGKEEWGTSAHGCIKIDSKWYLWYGEF